MAPTAFGQTSYGKRDTEAVTDWVRVRSQQVVSKGAGHRTSNEGRDDEDDDE